MSFPRRRESSTQALSMQVSRREWLLYCFGSWALPASAVACAFGGVVFELPISQAPGHAAFDDVLDFLRATNPAFTAASIQKDARLNVDIEPLPQNPDRRPVTIVYVEEGDVVFDQREIYLILENIFPWRDAQGQWRNRSAFSQVARFEFGKGALTEISTRIKASFPSAVLHVFYLRMHAGNIAVIWNHSARLSGAPCQAYRYF
jgi:hypothetical protein